MVDIGDFVTYTDQAQESLTGRYLFESDESVTLWTDKQARSLSLSSWSLVGHKRCDDLRSINAMILEICATAKAGTFVSFFALARVPLIIEQEMTYASDLIIEARDAIESASNAYIAGRNALEVLANNVVERLEDDRSK